MRKPSRRLTNAITETLETRRLLSAKSAITGPVLSDTGYGKVDNSVSDFGSVTTAHRGGPEDADYDIDVVFPDNTLTASQRAAFITAAARWTKVLTIDVVDGSYTDTNTNITYQVDDIRIEATGPSIDGPGLVLGSAGPTALRSGSLPAGQGRFLPLAGQMRFDSADLASLETSGTLVDVITHEMGHVLGLGTLWSSNFLNLRVNTGTTTVGYTGVNGVREWRSIAGPNTATGVTGEDSLTRVPVSNGTDGDGQGSRDSHWRERIFYNELMTHALGTNQSSPGTSGNPLSRMTAASMQDLGYPGVNLDGADFYQLTGRNPAPTIGSLTSTTDSPAVNSSFTLTANNVADASGVGSVSFYRESNGIPGLQTQFPSADTLIATDTTSPYSATTQLAATGSATFYARAVDTFGLVSILRTVSVNAIGGNPPTLISVPDLSTLSDSGVSNTDNITNDNTPTFTGTTNANTDVTLYRGTTVLGSTTSSGTGEWTITSSALADGSYNLTAIASNTFGQVSSGALSITIDTVSPTITSRTFDFQNNQSLDAVFNEPVTNVDSSDLLVVNNTTGQTLNSSNFLVATSATTASFIFNGLLPNGNYSSSLAGNIADIAGNGVANLPLTFFVLQGDANRDRVVDFNDLVILAANYNGSGRNFSQGNFNYSSGGLVDFNDLVVLAANYNVTLPANRGLASLPGNSFASDWARSQAATTRLLASTSKIARAGLFADKAITSNESDVRGLLV